MKKMGFALLASMVLCSSAMAAEDICMRDGICPSPSKKLWPTGGKTQTPAPSLAAEDICMRDGICPSPSKKLWPTGGKTQTPNLILARKIDYNNDCNPRLPPFIV